MNKAKALPGGFTQLGTLILIIKEIDNGVWNPYEAALNPNFIDH